MVLVSLGGSLVTIPAGIQPAIIIRPNPNGVAVTIYDSCCIMGNNVYFKNRLYKEPIVVAADDPKLNTIFEEGVFDGIDVDVFDMRDGEGDIVLHEPTS